MGACLLLGAILTLGQAPELPRAVAPAERGLFMRELQGTWPGALLDDNRMQLTGWADMAFTASSASQSNLPMGQNYFANDFQLLQNWVRLERTVVTSGTTEPTFGFRTDWILPGTDYRFTLARGIFNSQLTANDGLPNYYGFDPIQFYTEGYFPTIAHGMDVKFGRFYAICGSESNEAVSNNLTSHAYNFIYNPFTHTGLLATMKLNDAWTIQTGLILGSDDFIDPVDTPTFLGSIRWAPVGGRDNLYVHCLAGNGRYNDSRLWYNPDLWNIVYVRQLDARLSYTLDILHALQWNVPEIGFATWYGIVQYLNYQFTPRVNGTVRLEFFDDCQGFRTGFEGLYTEVTMGLQFRPWRSLIFRPEIRFDYNGPSRPFDDSHSLVTAAADVIVRW